jgi:lipoprotein NlpI
MRLIAFLVVAGVANTCLLAQEKKLGDLLDDARVHLRNGDFESAEELASRAIKADHRKPEAHFLRGQIRAAERRPADAISDFTAVIELNAKNANAYDARGGEQFKLGKIKESIADFDKAIELDAARERSHWRRGISYYYSGEFEKGQKQFEAYQTFEDNDVENAVWRYLCMARRLGAEKARADLLKIRRDPRVGMMETYALFAGKAKPEEVLDAAQAGKPKPQVLNEQLFYAHLYLGLYFDAGGDAKQAAKHIDQAVKHKIGHYMWDVAKVHAELLKKKAEKR